MKYENNLIVLLLENVFVVDACETRTKHLKKNQKEAEIDIGADLELGGRRGWVGRRVVDLLDDASDGEQDEREPLMPREPFVEEHLEYDTGDDDSELQEQEVRGWVVWAQVDER